MATLPEHSSHIEVELHFRGLLDDEGFAQPDEVRHEVDPDEVVFMWNEPKVAIVIEIGPDGPVDVRPRVNAHGPPV